MGRTAFLSYRHEIVQWYGFARLRAHVEASQIERFASTLPIHLPDDLILLPVANEIADALLAQCELERLGDVQRRDAHALRSFTLDRHAQLRLVEFEIDVGKGEDRLLPHGIEEWRDRVFQLLEIGRLQHVLHRKTTEAADRNGLLLRDEDAGTGHSVYAHHKAIDDLLLRSLALRRLIQDQKSKSGIDRSGRAKSG